MNSQDFRALQEAYMEVYDELDENIRPTEGSTRKTSTGETIYVNRPTKRGGRGIRRQPKVDAWGDWPLDRPRPKSEEVEVVDLFDIILSHLLDEGYAETQEAAEAIMVNMSEEWRESIVEGVKPYPSSKVEKSIARKDRRAQTDYDYRDELSKKEKQSSERNIERLDRQERIHKKMTQK